LDALLELADSDHKEEMRGVRKKTWRIETSKTQERDQINFDERVVN
jgi:hypothetical protein